MAARGEAGPISALEAYSWLEVYRRALEKEKPDAGVKRRLSVVSLGQQKMAAHLSPEEMKQALKRADNGGKNASPAISKALELISSAKTVIDYANLCNGFSTLNEGFRSVDYRLRDEETYGPSETLLACVGVIEQVMSRKVCDERQITLRELLYYLSILTGSPVGSMRPETGVASALVIGGYCKPESPASKEGEEMIAKIREGYRATYP